MKICNKPGSRVSMLQGLAVWLIISLFPGSMYAQTRLQLDETRVTGGRELPKVLYIVPWKESPPGIEMQPLDSLVDEELAPLEIDVFHRQGRYYEFLQSPRQIGQ